MMNRSDNKNRTQQQTGGRVTHSGRNNKNENWIKKYKFHVRRNGRQGATYASVVKWITLKIKSSFDRGRLVAESIETNTRKEPVEPNLQVSTLIDAPRRQAEDRKFGLKYS